MTNVVYVRFRDGREFPYLNDKFDLSIGDNVYVDGKLTGEIGTVTDVLENFKVSLRYYKYVTAKIDNDISGTFKKQGNYYYTTGKDAIPFEKMLLWVKEPESESEEPEEFIKGKGYTINLAEFFDAQDEPIEEYSENYYNALDVVEDGELQFVTVKDGIGKAVIQNERHTKTVEFNFDSEKMLMTDVYCDCISPRLCKDMLATAIAIMDMNDEDNSSTAGDFSIINDYLFEARANRKNYTVIV
jgi:hypothetical protein